MTCVTGASGLMPAPVPCELNVAPEDGVAAFTTRVVPGWTALIASIAPAEYAEKSGAGVLGAGGKTAPFCADAGPGVKAARKPPTVSTATANAATRALTRVLLLPVGPRGSGTSPSP